MARIKRIRSSNGSDKFIDTGTPNLSFLQLASDLKELGVKNYYFMLELYDVSLVHVNPHAVDSKGNCTLTKDEILRILAECRRNPWYYLREVCRIPDQGNPLGIPYKANRGNIAQAWCILHGIDSWLCLPRRIMLPPCIVIYKKNLFNCWNNSLSLNYQTNMATC